MAIILQKTKITGELTEVAFKVVAVPGNSGSEQTVVLGGTFEITDPALVDAFAEAIQGTHLETLADKIENPRVTVVEKPVEKSGAK